MATGAPLSLSLATVRGAGVRLYATLSPELREDLRWELGDTLTLDVGRDAETGNIRIRKAPQGRVLRALPSSRYAAVALLVPEDMGRWTAPRRAADYTIVRDMLLAVLPWSLQGEPAQAEADADAEASA